MSPHSHRLKPQNLTEARCAICQFLAQAGVQNTAICRTTAKQPLTQDAASNPEKRSEGLNCRTGLIPAADQAAQEAKNPHETPPRTQSRKEKQPDTLIRPTWWYLSLEDCDVPLHYRSGLCPLY
ncbi:Hypothetical predicted protein [Pelobates cultripes]|uniref:Uncharacterized protein n=1 Tax=Pelobates cultripes TaxID=61616 RepID=A0AAD1SLS6_PELCU|nr:Hypothetical predicted protein [Pelobates cultripes]